MQAGRLSLLLSLGLALVTGIVPMRECRPTDGCAGGLVAIGVHAHGDHHDHDSGDGGGPADACCEDVPFHVGIPARAVTLEAPPQIAQLLPIERFGAKSGRDAIVATDSDSRLDVGVPRGTRSVVLLR